MLQKLQAFMTSFCQKHTVLYMISYLGSYFLLFIAGALLPYFIRSAVYPVIYEKTPASGIIEDEYSETVSIASAGTHRTHSFEVSYFVVDGFSIPISGSDFRTHSIGDLYNYFLYESQYSRTASRHDYRLPAGIAGLLFFLLCLGGALCFTLIETNEAARQKDGSASLSRAKKKQQNAAAENVPDQRIHYQNYTTRELYELCLSRNLNIIHGKRKNRRYLEHCLMQEYQNSRPPAAYIRKTQRINRILKIIIGIAWILLVCNFSRHIYYLLGLFT